MQTLSGKQIWIRGIGTFRGGKRGRAGRRVRTSRRSRPFVAVSDQIRLSRLAETPAPLSILLAASDPDEAPNTTYAANPMARASFFIAEPSLVVGVNVWPARIRNDRPFDGAVVVFYPVRMYRARRAATIWSGER